MNVLRMIFPSSETKKKKTKKKKPKVATAPIPVPVTPVNESRAIGNGAINNLTTTKDNTLSTSPTKEEIMRPQQNTYLENMESMLPTPRRDFTSSQKGLSVRGSAKITEIHQTLSALQKQIDMKGDLMGTMEMEIETCRGEYETLNNQFLEEKQSKASVQAALDKANEENSKLKEQINIIQQNQWVLNNQYQTLQQSSAIAARQAQEQMAAMTQSYDIAVANLKNEIHQQSEKLLQYEENAKRATLQIETLQAEKVGLEVEMNRLRAAAEPN